MTSNRNNSIYSAITIILLSLLLVGSILFNFQTCSDNKKLNVLLKNKESTLSKKDTLLNQVLNNDSILVDQFGVLNPPEISMPILRHKMDSIAAKGNFGNSNINLSRGGYYTRTKFTAKLEKAKATTENDSIVEYKDDNWYLGFNKKSSVFDAQYNGEQEVFSGYLPKYSLGGLNLGKPELNTFKWFNNPGVTIDESETIYVPPVEKETDFKLYLNTEYRQGVNIGNKQAELIDGTTSLYQGIGASYQFKRHGVGIEGNYKVIGPDALPKQEIKVKYNFHIFK